MGNNPVKTYDNYISKIIPNITVNGDFCDKERMINDYIRLTLNRTSQIFNWRGLPDSIPQRMIELYLQVNGNTAIYKADGKLYAFTGGMGGELNPYYMPTIYTISNPALNISVNARINADCIVIPNDTTYIGIMPIISKYARLLIENEITLYVNMINARIPALIGADASTTADAASKYLQDIKMGKLGVIATSQFFDGLTTQQYNSASAHTLTDILEVEQYIKASLFNELGLQSNYNMKRERLTDDETALNEMALLPLIDDMLQCRKQGAKAINDKWDTNISVELNSAWEMTNKSVYEGGANDDESTNVV